MIGRRTLLAAAALLVSGAGPALADDPFIYRVGGEVTPANFEAFATFAMNSLDQFVGLKISLPEGTSDGLTVEEAGGILVAYMKGGDVQLSFPSGYRKSRGRYFAEGYYKASYAGMHQGINAVALTPARSMDVEASGKPLKNLEIGKLRADVKKN